MRKALYLLGILDDVDIEWMATAGTVETINAGTILIHENVPTDSIYVVLEGQMAVYVGDQADRPIAVLLPGEIIGELSFVDRHAPSASVAATRDAQVLKVPRQALSAKLAADQGFALRFYRAIAGFLADRLYVTVGRFGYGSAGQDAGVDEVPDSLLHDIDIAAVRFDKLLNRLRKGYAARVVNAS